MGHELFARRDNSLQRIIILLVDLLSSTSKTMIKYLFLGFCSLFGGRRRLLRRGYRFLRC